MYFSHARKFFSLLTVCLCLGGCQPPSKSTPHTPSHPRYEHEFLPVIDGVWQTQDCAIKYLNTDKKLVALTFDDAPTKKLDALLDVFLAFNLAHPTCPASATLFCNGRGLTRRAKESLYTAFTMGFELGNHTFSHHDLTTLSTQEIALEIDRVDTLLSAIDNKPLHLFRAPYGKLNEQVKQVVKVPIISWYIDTLDWADQSPQKLIQKALSSRLEDGAIILLHDGYDSTIEGVKQLLPALYQAGYQAVSVSQMAHAHGCALRVGGVYTRARKQ